MQIVDERDVRREEPVPHGRIGMSTAWRLTADVPRRTMEFRRRALHKGAAIGLHLIDHDEVYYVISGRGEVVADGVRHVLEPGMMAYLYTGEEVGIWQMGEEELNMIVSYPLAGN
ncbi:cupin domain-containing protein [Falsirhodobacter xinxiangensis]|uniref:cupin domain-containing protein n=1 Tax=Falsirhodobacter xinxiangensis TaxID=2530049 RepID=UPI0010A9E14D|nr:cupin domain-containing protein [Rhodobacter xinxiangensis]